MSKERLWDDSAFTPVGRTPQPPASLDALLADLGLGRADERERRHALSDWLANHEPSKRLVRSFERRGYGDLISG
ncbi:hypothetical protein GR168_09430 [Gordonia sp. JH63]|uniref:hypothetical protein n=1 Tax=Gordonia TaxID=2053 RepID=UPI00131FE8AB|nr:MULTISPECIES: hypothetical protein [Gordonia]QHD85577.1 hypothetical protein GR168_09430 [Gordonia sp. JH63]UPG70028.1 hypothetical protein MVF96_09785 [Gordonia hongkongensis]WGJ87330.1 hypothetical protein QAD21_09630 [Gordonia sp. SMJS1]